MSAAITVPSSVRETIACQGTPPEDRPVTTYREVFADGEFRALFAANAAVVAGMTMQMLALSALVYASTGSPLLAALAYLGGYLPLAIGALTLLSLADRVRPRAFLAAWDGVRALAAITFAVGVLPSWAILAIVMAMGLLESVTGAVRNALIVDILSTGGFVLGRSTFNASVGAMQIIGFAVGGTLIAVIGPHPALFASAAFMVVSALLTRFGLRRRAPRAAGRAGLRETWHGTRVLWRDPAIRALLLALWLPNGIIVGAEAMYVPYAGSSAGILFIAAALGMLAGDVVVGRWVSPGRLDRLITPLQTLLAVPYLIFVFHPGTWLAAGAVAVASFGFAAALGLQRRLLDAMPEQLRGQGLGLDSSGRMTSQAIGAFAVGSLAEAFGPAAAMTGAAVGSLLIVALLWRPLRRTGIVASGHPEPSTVS
ncbi:MFS transporter [Catellatospora chokoriensis]|uniref:MFS transporter n=1 Tax=Catellatospora chokoriensis TaxID=310353 RepID=UPI00178582E0|nr:MFS transporter [Catellatospora chokoriensis]